VDSDSADPTPPAATSPAVLAAVDGYAGYVAEQVAATVATTRVFTDAIRSGDLAEARASYAESRVGWERIEPIAGLVESFDGVVDARVDDFAGVDDPAFTGWHRLEHFIFVLDTTEGAVPFADRLDADLAELAAALPTLEIPASAMAIGASELIEEVSLGKITGEENRYAKTDLSDIEANLDGSAAAIGLLAPALQAADPGLLVALQSGFAELNTTLQPLRTATGWTLYCLPDDEFPSARCPSPTVTEAQVATWQAQLAALSEQTSQVAGALGLV
jgi:iron uptake system component EfeO